MTTRTFTFNAFALAIILLFAAKTQAQFINNAYVSAAGTLTASCRLADPCSSVDAALRVVSGGGEVVILDSGVFRYFTITRSVTVTAAQGAHPTIYGADDHPAIAVQNGVSAVLRGLRITPQRTAYFGISNVFRGALHTSESLNLVIENCVIDDSFVFGGILVGGGRLIVKDTTIRGQLGIVFHNGECIVDHCWFENNTDKAISLNGGVKERAVAIVRNSIVVNAGSGFSVGSLSTEALTADLTIENCTITSSRIGVELRDLSGIAARISNSTVTNNIFGFGGVSGASIYSRGNNTVSGNLLHDTSITVIPLPGT